MVSYVDPASADNLQGTRDLENREPPLDILRDDLASDTDASLDVEASNREKFLLEEGLELLAIYRTIGDPSLRRMVKRLVSVVAEGQTREQ